MKKTLIRLFIAAAVLLSVATGCSPPPSDSMGSLALIGHHDISFVSHDFDGTYSTWTYNVTSGSGPPPGYALSHWVISWCGDCDDVFEASEYYECKDEPDPVTGVTGIKFDAEYADDENRTVWFRLVGDYPEGNVYVGTKAGPSLDYGWITGPLCEPAVVTYNLTISSTIGGSANVTINPTTVIGPGETETIPEIAVNTTVNLSADVHAGYEFAGWTGDPVDGITETGTTILMQGDYAITAHFVAEEIVVTPPPDIVVGWETFPINKATVLFHWVVLFAAVMFCAILLSSRLRRT